MSIPTNLYNEKWKESVEGAVLSTKKNARYVSFIHLPKTGGTSISKAFENSCLWNFVKLGPSYANGSPNFSRLFVNGDFVEKSDFTKIETDQECPVFFKFAHENYAAVNWLEGLLNAHGGGLECTYSTYRPIRRRLISNFRDYWTQIYRYETNSFDFSIMTKRQISLVEQYQNDSIHYINKEGQIDGPKWFEAFEIFGSGVPFFMKDVFGDLEKRKHDVESGRLKFIRTESVQDFIRSMTEYSLTPRGRVSVKTNFRGIEEAIQCSSSLIDSLCEKDREYEALMERYPFG